MSTPNPRKIDERLKQSMTCLERALSAKTAGREYQWSASVADALDQMRDAMQSRPAAPASSDVVDQTRPTLKRQADSVCREYADCIVRADALHGEIQRVSHTFAPKDRAGARDDAGKVEAIPDFADLRQRAADLLNCLQHVRDEEAHLVLESVNTDIGVGD